MYSSQHSYAPHHPLNPRNIYVTNLPNISTDEFYRLFVQFGPIRRYQIKTYNSGLVEYFSDVDASTAVKELYGRTIVGHSDYRPLLLRVAGERGDWRPIAVKREPIEIPSTVSFARHVAPHSPPKEQPDSN